MLDIVCTALLFKLGTVQAEAIIFSPCASRGCQLVFGKQLLLSLIAILVI